MRPVLRLLEEPLAAHRRRLRAGERRLQLGDPRVPFGELGAEPAEGVVDVRHPVAAGHHGQSQRFDVRTADRPVRGQRVGQLLGRHVLQDGTLPPPTTARVTAATTTTIASSKNQNTRISPGAKTCPAPIVPCGADS